METVMHTAPACLTVAGFGPGSEACISPEVREALARAEVVAGYTAYVDALPPDWLHGKRLIATGMRDEIGRCRQAALAALEGRETVLVCSGDAGVYALAGLLLELVEAWGLADTLPVRVLPGIPAVCAAAALLGAPLTHDFACVSLSDLLTPWETIERRAHAALAADFVLALYNPRSHRRNWQFASILDHIADIYGDKRVAGVVRQAYRAGQTVWTGTVGGLDPETVDMVSIVLIGNSATRIVHGRMVTPRGYLGAYDPGSLTGSQAVREG